MRAHHKTSTLVHLRSRVDIPYLEGAVCRGDSFPDKFFPVSFDELRDAQETCSQCPVAAQCLRGAKVRKESDGVWGGELFRKGEPVDPRMVRDAPLSRGRSRREVPMF